MWSKYFKNFKVIILNTSTSQKQNSPNISSVKILIALTLELILIILSNLKLVSLFLYKRILCTRFTFSMCLCIQYIYVSLQNSFNAFFQHFDTHKPLSSRAEQARQHAATTVALFSTQPLTTRRLLGALSHTNPLAAATNQSTQYQID